MSESEPTNPTPSGTDVMDLDAFVPALVTFLSNRLTSTGSATYRSRFGIGIMDFRVLAMLSIEPGASGARIARVIGLDEAAVSRTLSALSKRGLVSLKAAHGRSRAVSLTPEGARIYAAAWAIAKDRERLLLAGLDEGEQTTLRALLRKLLQAASALAALATEPGEHGNEASHLSKARPPSLSD